MANKKVKTHYKLNTKFIIDLAWVGSSNNHNRLYYSKPRITSRILQSIKYVNNPQDYKDYPVKYFHKLNFQGNQPKVGRENGSLFLSVAGWDALKADIETEFKKLRPTDSWDEYVFKMEEYFKNLAEAIQKYAFDFEKKSLEKIALLKQFTV